MDRVRKWFAHKLQLTLDDEDTKLEFSTSIPIPRVEIDDTTMERKSSEDEPPQNQEINPGGLSPKTPVIQISQPSNKNKNDKGVDNPVFKFDESFDEGEDDKNKDKTLSQQGKAGPQAQTVPNVLIVPPAGKQKGLIKQDSVSSTDSIFKDGPPQGESMDKADPESNDKGPMVSPHMHHLAPQPGGLAPMSPGRRSLRSNWSELERLDSRRNSHDSIGSYHSVEGQEKEDTGTSGMSSAMSSRLLQLVRKFESRTERFKEKTQQPPTPSTGSPDAKSAISATSAAELEPPQGPRQHRLDSFLPGSRISGAESGMEEKHIGIGLCKVKVPKCFQRFKLSKTFEAQNKIYISWLLIVTLAYMYNAASFTLRMSFRDAEFYIPEDQRRVCKYVNESDSTVTMSPNTTQAIICHDAKPRIYKGYETADNRIYWWICDYTADFIYILDILFVKTRVRFLENGLTVDSMKRTAKHYFTSTEFKFDMASLIPLDLLYLIPALEYNSMVRFPRLLKIHTFWEFYNRMDQAARSAHVLRVFRTMTYMLFLIHLESCGYYAMSAYEGLKKNSWVYSGEGIAYVRCMYLATKTATSIGNNPKPENELEYMFMTVYWLSGVFVFAMLIGQIRDIFQSAGAAHTTYRKTMDDTVTYMKSLDLPHDLQSKVKTWFTYNWQYQKTLDEMSLLDALPSKMKADLAIHVHYHILSKVQLFQDCDKNLLFDLVLKLKPCLYLPMDYICRKGDVGTEMYIVMSGQVEVVGGENNSIVFATLHEGSVFGEISLLALAGGNRRTADVRSKGFSNLFILSKNDFEEAMSDYPDAQKILKKRARKILTQNAKHTKKESKMEAEEVVVSRHGTPKLLRTVVQMVKQGSTLHDLLGTRKSSGSRGSEKDIEIPDLQKDGLEPYNPDEEEEEILIIEQTESPMPENEDQEFDDGSLSVRQDPILRSPTPLPPQSDSGEDRDSMSSAVQAILNSPSNTPPLTGRDQGEKKGKKKLENNESSSKTSQEEPLDKTLGTKQKNKGKLKRMGRVSSSSNSQSPTPPLSKPKLQGTNKVHPHEKSPLHTLKPIANTKTTSQMSKAQPQKLKKSNERTSNKIGVAPPDQENGTSRTLIPMENKVICDVQVHREKSISPADHSKKGVDNVAFIRSESMSSL